MPKTIKITISVLVFALSLLAMNVLAQTPGVWHPAVEIYGQPTVTQTEATFPGTKYYFTEDLIINDQVGIGTTGPITKLDVRGGIFANDGTAVTGFPPSGAGVKFFWYPARRAFRAGEVTGSSWNDANIGNYSFSLGYNTKASGMNHSLALGYQTTASGDFSSTAMGAWTTASGSYSTAMGYQTLAEAWYSTAMGAYTSARGDYSTAIGAFTTTDLGGTYSIVLGRGIMSTSRLVNNIANSLMIGFNSNIPTLFVGPSSGAGTTGNVGIGTTGPRRLLHVGPGTDDSIAVFTQLLVTRAGETVLSVRDSTNDVETVMASYAGTGEIGTVTNHDLLISTNNTSRITVKAGGNVGIGKDPGEKLDVNGNIRGSGNIYTTYPGGYAQTYLQQWGLLGGAGAMYLEPGAGQTLYLTDQWNATGKVHVVMDRLAVGPDSATENVRLYKGGNAYFAGSVGIGVTPSYRLDVRGTTNAIYGYVNEPDAAADNRQAIYGYRTRAVRNDGSGYGYSQTNAAIKGYNYWGDSYTFGVAGYSWNDFTRTGGVIGAKQDGTYWGALGYRDENSATWGVYTPNNAYVGGTGGNVCHNVGGTWYSCPPGATGPSYWSTTGGGFPSTSWSDLLTLSISVNNNSVLQIFFSGTSMHQCNKGAAWGSYRVVVDGAVIDPVIDVRPDDDLTDGSLQYYVPVAISTLAEVASGPHTVTVQHINGVADIYCWFIHSGVPARLMVFAFPR